MPSKDTDENQYDGQAREWASARRVLARQGPPAHVEAALLRAFERRHAPLPWYRRLGVEALVSGLSLAGVGCLAALVVAGMVRSPAATPALPDMAASRYVTEQGFLSLVDAQHLKLATHVLLLHAELPRHVLVSLGVPLNMDMPDELVRTELVVTKAGEPVAVRVAFN